MRYLMIVIATLMAAPVKADDVCLEGKTDIIKLTGWSAVSWQPSIMGKPMDGMSGVAITLNLKNESNSGILMVNGAVFFSTVLDSDRLRNGTQIDPNLRIASGETADTTLQTLGMDWLAASAPEDVQATLCVTGVVYSDGSKAVFE